MRKLHKAGITGTDATTAYNFWSLGLRGKDTVRVANVLGYWPKTIFNLQRDVVG